jgi:hypothetical protein
MGMRHLRWLALLAATGCLSDLNKPTHRGNNQPNYPTTDPAALFKALFGSITPTQSQQATSQRRLAGDESERCDVRARE